MSFNTISLYTLGMAFNFDVLITSEIACNMGSWIRFVFEDITYWVLVWITINRIAAITWVTRLRWLTSIRTTCIALGTIVLYSILFNIHSFWVFNIEQKVNRRNNRTILSCDIYVEAASSGFVDNALVMFGYLEPLVPFSLLVVLSVFLGCRLIAIASKRRKLLKGSVARVPLSVESHSAAPQTDQNAERQGSEERWLRKEVQLALVIISFSVAEILIEGTSDILSAILILLKSINKSDHNFTTRNNVVTLNDINFKLQDASILLRIWNFIAYLVIMPSFRQAVIDFLKSIRLVKCKESESDSV